MKNVLVFVLLISIILVIGILYFDSYTCSKHVVETFSLSDQKIQEINTRYNFSVTEGELPLFKQLLVDNNYMKLYEIYRDTGFVFKGSYKDQSNRAVPRYLGNRFRRPLDCVQTANNNGYTVAGLQYYGQCFGGTDLSRAMKYGKDIRRHATYPLGVDWNNQVYAKEFVRDEDVSNLDVQGYEEVIKFLVTPEVNINSYTEFKNLMELIQKESTSSEYFTTVEGLEAKPELPLNDPESTSVTAANAVGNAYRQIKEDWEGKLSDPGSGYVFEFTINTAEYPDLVANAISEFAKLDNVSLENTRKMFQRNEIRSSFQIQLLINKLSQIGYTNNSTANLYEILDVLNKYGRKGSEEDIDYPFILRYQGFGLTSTSDLHTFLKQLMDLNVRDPKSTSLATPQPISFATFVTLVSSLGVNYASFDRFYSIMTKLYIPPSQTDFDRFITDVKKYFGKRSITLVDLETFKNDLDKYKITYIDYITIRNNYLSKVTINDSNKVFFPKFIDYYNTDYITGLSAPLNAKISTDANSTGAISLLEGIQRFFTRIRETGFQNPSNRQDINFSKMIKEYVDLHVSATTIKGDNDVIQPATPTGKQGFSTLEGMFARRVEGMEPNKYKYPIYGYYDSLKKLYMNNANNMNIILPENEAIGQQPQTTTDLGNRLTEYFGAQNDDDRVIILSYMVAIQTPGSQLYKCANTLKTVGVNMSNFDKITNALYDVKLTTFPDIFDFLTKLGQLKVTLEDPNPQNSPPNNLDRFTTTLTEFGAVYNPSSKDRSFFRFLDTLIFYNITNTTSTYDMQNTKFYNFMYNMKLDNIKFDQYKQFEFAMFTAFTATPLRNYIPYEHEKPILDIQMRDIIIRKDSLLFGVDNTINGKNSNEPVNGELDTTLNIPALYADITNNKTIMPLVPINTATGVVTAPQKIYVEALKYSSYINQENLRIVSQILTPYEYRMIKTNPGRLHVRSVMSRLCLILKTNIGNYDRSMPADCILNSARTFPYLTFRKLYESFMNSGTIYDMDNSTRNEGNVYRLLPPVKEPEEGFATLTTGKDSYGNYQSAFSSNTAFPFVKISDTKLYDSYDLSKTSFMKHSNVM
jgi:hypothetical protein